MYKVVSNIASIQRPYSVSPQGSAIPAEETNRISWKVSGAIQTKFDIQITYNNTTALKLTDHGLSDNDLIIDTTRDATVSGIRIATVLNADNISASYSISNLAVGDSIDKFIADSNVTSTAAGTSTTTQLDLTNTGSIVAGDIVEVNNEYRFVSSVVANTSITVDTAFSSATASQTVKAWHKSGTQTVEYPFQLTGNSSYNLYYDLLANSLVNGQEFRLVITIYDSANNSASSDPVVFSTSSRPTVTIDTVTTVNSSSYNFTATYSQAENTAIKSYLAILYNSNKVKVDSSDLLTSTPLQYRFNNLVNGDSYYVEFQVTSAKGLTATSGLVTFNVSYDAPNISVNLTAENTDNAGIKLSMNILQIIGSVSGVVSFPDNTSIDVTQGSVIFDSSITVDQEFTMKLWISSPKSKSDLLILNGANGKMTLQYDVVDKKFHFTKFMTNSIKSTWVSNEVQYDKYFVIIQQFLNGDINISVEPSTI